MSYPFKVWEAQYVARAEVRKFRRQTAFMDIHVFNPYAASNQHQQQSVVYRMHENEKKV